MRIKIKNKAINDGEFKLKNKKENNESFQSINKTINKETNKKNDKNKIENNLPKNSNINIIVNRKENEFKNNDKENSIIYQNEGKSIIDDNIFSKNEHAIKKTLTNKNKIENIYDTDFTNTKKYNSQKMHTKYGDDNMRRKCKHLVLDSIFNHINNVIRKLYNNNIGQGILIKQLRILNQKQISEGNIKFNQEFLYKNIGEIFSDKISGRITNSPPYINKSIIQNLLNEKDRALNIYFNKLFSLTFFECLEHFRGTKYFPELNGMDNLKKKLDEYQNDPDYASNIEYYINNYEIILNNKKSRKKRQKKEKNINSI